MAYDSRHQALDAARRAGIGHPVIVKLKDGRFDYEPVTPRPICRFCRFWSYDPPSESNEGMWPDGACLKIEKYPPDNPTAQIIAEGNGYLGTGPEFGCVLWEVQ